MIDIEIGDVVHTAAFTRVRFGRSNILELGWAALTIDGVRLRFPAIVAHRPTKKGYVVYTVPNRKAPLRTFGDLSGAHDWAALCASANGKFINPSTRASGNPLVIRSLDIVPPRAPAATPSPEASASTGPIGCPNEDLCRTNGCTWDCIRARREKEYA